MNTQGAKRRRDFHTDIKILHIFCVSCVSGLPNTYSPLLFTNTNLDLPEEAKFSISQAPLLLKWPYDRVLAH